MNLGSKTRIHVYIIYLDVTLKVPVTTIDALEHFETG